QASAARRPRALAPMAPASPAAASVSCAVGPTAARAASAASPSSARPAPTAASPAARAPTRAARDRSATRATATARTCASRPAKAGLLFSTPYYLPPRARAPQRHALIELRHSRHIRHRDDRPKVPFGAFVRARALVRTWQGRVAPDILKVLIGFQ